MERRVKRRTYPPPPLLRHFVTTSMFGLLRLQKDELVLMLLGCVAAMRIERRGTAWHGTAVVRHLSASPNTACHLLPRTKHRWYP